MYDEMLFVGLHRPDRWKLASLVRGHPRAGNQGIAGRVRLHYSSEIKSIAECHKVLATLHSRISSHVM
jgi:hypothetical protein